MCCIDKEDWAIPGVQVMSHPRLSQYTTFRIGGEAPLLITAMTHDGLIRALHKLHEERICPLILGKGSNLLVSDRGVRVPVLRLAGELAELAVKGTRLVAGGGALLPHAARRSCLAGLSGIERLSGIPGTLAGAVFMNAGCEGVSIGERVQEVEAMTLEGKRVTFRAQDFEWGYRRSVFSKKSHGKDLLIITKVILDLSEGSPETLLQERLRILRLRREKFPLSLPSAGSFFKATDKGPAGLLIDQAGLKGRAMGGACVSSRHANFIVNTGHATSQDVRRLADEICTVVLSRFGEILEPEVLTWE